MGIPSKKQRKEAERIAKILNKMDLFLLSDWSGKCKKRLTGEAFEYVIFQDETKKDRYFLFVGKEINMPLATYKWMNERKDFKGLALAIGNKKQVFTTLNTHYQKPF